MACAEASNRLRKVLTFVVALGVMLLGGVPASGADASNDDGRSSLAARGVAVTLNGCVPADALEIRRILVIELADLAIAMVDPENNEGALVVQVRCAPDLVTVATGPATGGGAQSNRVVSLSAVDARARARTVALAVTELVAATLKEPSARLPVAPAPRPRSPVSAASTSAVRRGRPHVTFCIDGGARRFNPGPAAQWLTFLALRLRLPWGPHWQAAAGIRTEAADTAVSVGRVAARSVAAEAGVGLGLDGRRLGASAGLDLAAGMGWLNAHAPIAPDVAVGSLSGVLLGAGAHLGVRARVTTRLSIGGRVEGGYGLAGPRGHVDRLWWRGWQGPWLGGALGIGWTP